MPNNKAAFHQAIYLTGPTAVGKSEVSLLLAEKLNAEIVALDAMTLYQGMDIGTAKPSKADQALVKHHLIDTLSPQTPSCLNTYIQSAQDVLNNIADRGKTALFVGGAPLYLKACLRGLSELPETNEQVRLELTAQAEALGVTTLHEQLAQIDPETASKIASTDLRRIVRALEIYKISGEPPSSLRNRHDQLAPSTVPVIALIRDRQSLYDRINKRVETMFATGLLEEATALPRPLSHTALQAVGYAEAFDLLDSKITLAQAIEKTQIRTRHYAKHQLTWYRNLSETRGFRVDKHPLEEQVNLLFQQIRAIQSGQEVSSDPI
jgi:tRNA dimethylallyltransferase